VILPERARRRLASVRHDELPDFPFRRTVHDRLADRRADEEFLAHAWSDPSTRVLVMVGPDLVVDDDGSLAWHPPATAPPGDRMLLGAVDGVAHFVVLTAEGTPGTATAGLRELALTLDEAEAGLAVHATGLANWHHKHPRCSVCGEPTEVSLSGEMRTCPACGAQHFPRTDPAVIMLVVDEHDRCLLGHNVARRTTWYSTLAGFVEPGESPEQAVVREVREETGVEVTDVRYAGSQPWPFPSSLMLGYLARATTTDVVVDGEEIADARWFSRDDVRRQVEAGDLVLPTTISIAGALISCWYGAELPANRL
jgi:NAD+ diphosphatase